MQANRRQSIRLSLPKERSGTGKDIDNRVKRMMNSALFVPFHHPSLLPWSSSSSVLVQVESCDPAPPEEAVA